MPPSKEPRDPRPSRQGLVEYFIVLALLALAAVGTVAIFGDDVRALFGIAPPRAAAPSGTDIRSP